MEMQYIFRPTIQSVKLPLWAANVRCTSAALPWHFDCTCTFTFLSFFFSFFRNPDFTYWNFYLTQILTVVSKYSQNDICFKMAHEGTCTENVHQNLGHFDVPSNSTNYMYWCDVEPWESWYGRKNQARGSYFGLWHDAPGLWVRPISQSLDSPTVRQIKLNKSAVQ